MRFSRILMYHGPEVIQCRHSKMFDVWKWEDPERRGIGFSISIFYRLYSLELFDLIGKNQIWKFIQNDSVRIVILSNNGRGRWGAEGTLGWGFGGLEIPYGKDKEEVVIVDAFSKEYILENYTFTGEYFKN